VQVEAIVRTESTRRRAPLPAVEAADPLIPVPLAEPALAEPPLVEPDDVVPEPLEPEPVAIEPSMWPVTSTCSPT